LTVVEEHPPEAARPDSRSVRAMFSSIAPHYDFLNHFLSLSVDRYWRRRAVQLLKQSGARPEDRCLDLCAGTGDLALDVRNHVGLDTYAVDFCHPMLVRFREKLEPGGGIQIAESDAQQLPFPDETFRFVTVAFGLRNVEDRSLALGEMYRVLSPGGILVVLEFSRPVVPVLRELFQFYFRYILPRLGSWISGTEGPYAYLPDSVDRFSRQSELADELRAAGWRGVGYANLSFGIAALHWGIRP